MKDELNDLEDFLGDEKSVKPSVREIAEKQSFGSEESEDEEMNDRLNENSEEEEHID